MNNGYRHPRGPTSPMVVVGYVFSVLLPVVGLVVGIILLSNGPRNHGIAICALSVVIGAASYVLLF